MPEEEEEEREKRREDYVDEPSCKDILGTRRRRMLIMYPYS